MERILNKLRGRLDVEDVNLLEELLILEGIFFYPSVVELEQAIEDVTCKRFPHCIKLRKMGMATLLGRAGYLSRVPGLTRAGILGLSVRTRPSRPEWQLLKGSMHCRQAVENGNTNVVQKISDLLSVFVSQVSVNALLLDGTVSYRAMKSFTILDRTGKYGKPDVVCKCSQFDCFRCWGLGLCLNS
ncbi:hypothetical protein Dsin_009834 [Dipteronia sinensis]|uniref:Uncharacterized protein n=1 Tax=Dipteronia sinensis TaxID=43782 RepID=A0AAE0ASM0_9ROSI|nr:hypothetical protein Dsin_009834 [Dipteronia sinensis]